MLLLNHVSDFAIHIVFESSGQVELDFCGLVIRISLNVKSQGANNSKHLRCKILYIVDYEYVNITGFAVLDVRLGLEEENELVTDQPLFKFTSLKAQN